MRRKVDTAWIWEAFCPSSSGVSKQGPQTSGTGIPPWALLQLQFLGPPGDLLDLNSRGAGPAECENHCGGSVSEVPK